MGNFHPHQPVPSPSLRLKLLPLITLFFALAILAVVAVIPLRFQAIDERLLTAAGKGTTPLTELAASLLNSEHLGAGLRLALLSQSLNLPENEAVLQSARTLLSSRRDLAWLGTRDSRLELVLATSGLAFETIPSSPPPTLTLLLREPVRIRLRQNLRANPSPGVQSLLETLSLHPLPPLLPAQSPGGQPLEAVLLLTAHLLDTQAFTPSFAGDLKTATYAAIDEHSLRPLQPTLLAMLSLSRRYEYDSLREILGTMDSLPALAWISEQIRSPLEPADLLLAAALWAGPADRLAQLPLPAVQPWANLTTAIASGRGSVELLVQRHVPVIRNSAPIPLRWTSHLLRFEKPLLLLRIVLLLLGSWFLVDAIWRLLPGLSPTAPGPWRPTPRVAQAALLALLLGTMLEPALLHPRPFPKYRLSLADPAKTAKLALRKNSAMDSTNLITLAIFLGLQIIVYRICLRRIQQIETGPGDSNLKLRLLENEDNLFDAGLYVGIGGTATALVLQVVGVIQPSLLAAYASNLFGIACVAVVKIFHVRALKYRLLLPPQQP